MSCAASRAPPGSSSCRGSVTPGRLALVDVISKGRLDIGVGRGNRPAEFKGYHVPQQENRERFDEAIDIMLRAWTEERFSHKGRFFTIEDARVIPKPVQRPHPTIYQVCGSDDGVESSAARGWPMLNSVLTGPVDQLVNHRSGIRDPDKLRRTIPASSSRL